MSAADARLRRLADLAEIRELKARYCRLVDNGYASAGDDPDAFAGLFAPDGIWAVGGEPAVGRDAIRARAGGSRRFRLHLATNAIVDVEGDRASARWHGLVPTTGSDGRAYWLAGTYDDTLVRGAESWRFAHVRFVTAFRTPYDESWRRPH